MKNLFHMGTLDEWGNEYCIPCDHHVYNRDCSYCSDVYSYINYEAKKGYSNCEDMVLALELGDDEEKKQAWEDMKSYYNKYSAYEPEYEPKPTEEELKEAKLLYFDYAHYYNSYKSSILI